MIATPNTLRDQILGRINQMLGKSKDEKIKFDIIDEMIVTTHNIYSDLYESHPDKTDVSLFVTTIGKDSKGSKYVVAEDESGSVRVKKNLIMFNIDDLYAMYQQLSFIISPSTAVYAEIADEA